jgi:prevent-host-death family protein
MEAVGIRKLKQNLSRYLKRVKAGERILVTDRNKEIAIILPTGKKPQDQKLLELIQRGAVHWSGGRPAGIASRIPSRGKAVSEAVLEDRR